MSKPRLVDFYIMNSESFFKSFKEEDIIEFYNDLIDTYISMLMHHKGENGKFSMCMTGGIEPKYYKKQMKNGGQKGLKIWVEKNDN